MRRTISRDKAFKILECFLFIGFSIVAGWFASGVIKQFFSRDTNFTQHEKKITEYPVVAILFSDLRASEVNLNNFEILYLPNYSWNPTVRKLGIGKNYFHNDDFNKTEIVIVESFKNYHGFLGFRIIHSTPILMILKVPPEIVIKLITKLQKFENFNSEVHFYLTSLSNSPGFWAKYWKDGKPFHISMIKNSAVKCNIQAQITNYLRQTDKCQKESFSECIASQIDEIEFNECPKKCMNNAFANLGKYYQTPYCKNDTLNQQCIYNYMMEMEMKGILNCKKSCSVKEYTGETFLRYNQKPQSNETGEYYFKYVLNDVTSTKVYKEYLIYDAIGMVGSVGGTLGMVIEL